MMRTLQGFAAALLPVGLAIALCLILFGATGYNVAEVVQGVIEGALTGYGSSTQTLRWAMPLFLIAVGFMFSVRAGEFNIGGQGQMMMGGLGAVIVALLIPGPPAIIVPIALLVGTLAGILWSWIAGALKQWMGADEVIVTLMLNFIAMGFLSWVTTGPLKDPQTRGDTASTPRIDETLRLSDSSGMSVTLLALLALVALGAWLVAERSKLGLQLRFMGASEKSAKWQGMNVRRLKLWAYVLAGLFAGLAGALEVLGPNGRVVTGATPTIGFTALVVTIVGGTRVWGIVFAALFFGGIQSAILFLPIVSDLPTSGLRILEGAIALLITAHFIGRRRRG